MGNSAAKSVTGVVVEAGQSGLYQLLPATAVASVTNITTSIPGSATTGMKLVIYVSNHSATGTIAIVGTAPLSGAAASETTTSFAVPELPGEPVIYETTTPFATVTSVTPTGLTGGQIQIFGAQCAKSMVVGEWKFQDKFKEHSQEEQRGSYDKDFHLLRLASDPEWELAADFYVDNGLWLYYGAYNSAPTVTAVPSGGTSILSSTSVVSSGTTSSGFSTPVFPGQIIQGTLAGGPTTAATLSLTGTNIAGQTITETLIPTSNTAGTYTSVNRYATVTSITYGAFGGSATITLKGYTCWVLSGNPGDTLASFAAENYDSTGNYGAPFLLVDEWGLEFGMDKEAKVAAKGPCQGVFPLGDITNNANQITAFGQPLDEALTGWRAVIWIDSATNSPGSTQNQDVIDGKFAIKVNWMAKHTSWGNPPTRVWNRAYRKRREVTLEVTLDMTQATYQTELKAFRERRKRYVQIQLIGPYLGTVTSVNYYLGAKIILPLKWVDVPERDFASGKESVELKLKGIAEYDPGLGYSHNVTFYSSKPSW